jgi:tetratricopeptide (TPR) repeat protein
MKQHDNGTRRRWIALALAAITLALFSPLCQHDFIGFDDQAYVTENPSVRSGLNANSLAWAFQTSTAGNWHPVTWISHFLDVQFFGVQAGWHHLTNVLLHCANVALLFLLLQRMTGAVWRSALVAALFGWHPAHVESVAWIAERKDVLSAFFWMLTLWAYVRYAEEFKIQNSKFRIFYALALIFFALGLMSKPMVVTLPFILLLLDFWPLRRVSLAGMSRPWLVGREVHCPPSGICTGTTVALPSCGGQGTARPTIGNPPATDALPAGPTASPDNNPSGTQVWPRRALSRLLVEKIPFLALSAIGCVLTVWAQQRSHAVASVQEISLSHRFVHVFVSYFDYLSLLIFPRHLAIFYPYPLHEQTVRAVGGLAALAAVSTLAFLQLRRRPWLAVGWLWFVGMLVPVIGVVQVGGQAFADRYTYLPFVGLFICGVWAGADLARRIPAAKFLAPVVTAAMLAATAWQIPIWKNTRTVFEHAVSVTRNNYLALTLLGSLRAEDGDWDGAIPLYQEALRDNQNYAEAHFFLARADDHQGKLDQALREYERALRINPSFEQARIFLGLLLAGEKQYDRAAAQYEAVLKTNPRSAPAHNDLARLLQSQGRLEESVRHYTAALQFDPSLAEAHNNLGILYVQQGRLAGGTAELREALLLHPGNEETEFNLALALNEQGQWREALVLWQRLAPARPKDPAAQFQCGRALAGLGKTGEAMSQFAAALLLTPDSPEALQALAWILSTDPHPELRHGGEAVPMAEKACQLTDRRQPVMLVTLAAAYAEAGRFDEAVAAARQARDLTAAQGQKEIETKAGLVLVAVQAGHPFREPQPFPQR